MESIDKVMVGQFVYKNKDYNFNFFTDISLSKKIAFVKSVVESVIDEDHYYVIAKDVLFGFQIINYFSDALDAIKGTDGDVEATFSIAQIEDIVINTKIVEIIEGKTREGLIDELRDAVNKDIEYRTGIHANPLSEAVASLLSALESKFKDIDLGALMGFAEVFKGMTGKDLTAEKMFDAYANSEAFKQVREEADDRNAQKTARVIEFADELKKKKEAGQEELVDNE